MNQNFPNSDRPDAVGLDATSEGAEETLRLVARLSPPEELTERVHRRIAQGTPERRGFWSLWQPAQRLQFAGAAVLAIAVAGSLWSVSHRHLQPGTAKQVAAPQVATPRTGDFVPAGAERVPPTLKPIQVPPAPKKKPSAGHARRVAAAPASSQP